MSLNSSRRCCRDQVVDRSEQGVFRRREGNAVGPLLMTVGYEGRDAGELCEQLRRSSVDVLVDVRELPLSRRRGFSKSALRERLEAAGIVYAHDRRLGNPKTYRQ